MRIASLLRQVARRPLVVAQQPRIVGSARLTLVRSFSFQHWNNNDNKIHRFSTDVAAIEEPETEPKRVRFEDIDIHPKSLKALRRRDLLHMTEIQEKTFEACVQGKDVLGRARTGTGKTVAFLLPGIERILRNPIDDQVNMLILSPTRELAAQIAEQTQMLVGVHGNAVTAQVIYGGSSKRDDIQRFEKKIPNILVATPGRLKDHLMSTNVHGTSFVDKVQKLQVLVLDETDRLLDMGFRQEIQDILSFLPKDRQTLLFSATLPQDVRTIIRMAAKPDYVTIDCIEDEDPMTHTNDRTEQSHVVLPPSRFLTGTVETLLDLVDNPNNKIMVFFPMTSMVQLYTNLFSFRLGRRVLELHGKMQQRSRSQISRQFRQSRSGTLFTSDVSARGIDYPDVTHVVQVGAAESRETYIHRLGRTGRAGKKGQGLLILPKIETHFLYDLKGLDVSVNSKLQAKLDAPPAKKMMDELGPIAADVRAGKDKRLVEAASEAYLAMVSYYFQRSNKRKGNPDQVVNTINSLIQDIGMTELPAVDVNRARKFGCEHVRGLNIKHNWSDRGGSSEGWGQGSSDRSSRRGAGGRTTGGGRGSPGGGRGRQEPNSVRQQPVERKSVWDTGSSEERFRPSGSQQDRRRSSDSSFGDDRVGRSKSIADRNGRSRSADNRKGADNPFFKSSGPNSSPKKEKGFKRFNSEPGFATTK